MEFLSLACQRRSINFFDSSFQLPREVLARIIELAALTPTASNTQPWEVVAVDDLEMKSQLAKLAFNQPKIEQSSAVLIIAGDKNGYKSENPAYQFFQKNGYMTSEALESFIQGTEGFYQKFQTAENYAIRNSALFAMSVMYAAENFGINSHPMIGFDSEKVRLLVGLPEQYLVNIIICLGKFNQAEKLLPRNARKSAADSCSFNHFQNKSARFDNQLLANDQPVSLKSQQFHLQGFNCSLGSEVYDFTVVDRELKPVTLKSLIGERRGLIISAVPSLDTPVCSIQTKQINQKLSEINQDYNIVTISCDTPFAQQRFCSTEKIEFPFYSDYKNLDFSIALGLLIAELRLTARCLLVIDSNMKLVYKQLVSEISNEPDYQDLFNFIEK